MLGLRPTEGSSVAGVRGLKPGTMSTNIKSTDTSNPDFPQKGFEKLWGSKTTEDYQNSFTGLPGSFFLAFSSNTIYVCPKEINSFYEIFQPR